MKKEKKSDGKMKIVVRTQDFDKIFYFFFVIVIKKRITFDTVNFHQMFIKGISSRKFSKCFDCFLSINKYLKLFSVLSFFQYCNIHVCMRRMYRMYYTIFFILNLYKFQVEMLIKLDVCNMYVRICYFIEIKKILIVEIKNILLLLKIFILNIMYLSKY